MRFIIFFSCISFQLQWSDMLKAFLQEAKWCHDKHLPKFDDYLNNAWISVSGVVILTHAYVLMNHKPTKEALEALESHHALLKRPSIIFRLCNDLGTSTVTYLEISTTS